MRKLSLLAIGLVLLVCLLAYDQQKPDQGRIRIGLIESTSGPEGSAGQEVLRGVRLAQDTWTRVLGNPVDLVVYDMKSQTYEASNGLAQLAEVEGVHALIGPHNDQAARDLARMVQATGLPTISGASSSSQIQKTGYYHLIAPDHRDQARAMASFSTQNLGIKNIAICIDEESSYGQDLARHFKEALPAYVKTREVNYHKGERSFPFILKELKNFEAGGIYCPGQPEVTASLIEEVKEAFPKVQVLGADHWDHPSFYDQSPAVEGAYFTSHFSKDRLTTGRGASFYQAYRQAHAQDPTSFAALGYDSYMVLAQALDRAGSTDPEDINRALLDISKYAGVTGIIDLSSRRSELGVDILIQGPGYSSWEDRVVLAP